jgi:8-oxo-dGTP diphosphatase
VVKEQKDCDAMIEKPFSKKVYDKIRKTFPLIAVVGLIKDKRGVLFTYRKIEPYKDYWILPGGSVSFKERLKKAVEREVKEETGLKVRAVKYLGYYDNPSVYPKNRRAVDHAFICKIISGRIKPNFESSEVRFFKKLPKNIGFDHRKILRDAGVK